MRILLIEDEARIAKNLQTLLRKASYAVDIAPDGESGLTRLHAEAYDLAIIDWQLPGQSGPEVCAAARSTGLFMPILMLTSRSQIEDKVAGLSSGADDYLVKPFAFEELHARVLALLRRPSATLSSDQLIIGDLCVDTTKASVTRAGQNIELSPREYALLEYLARFPEQIHSRLDLLSHVWDENADPFSNTVDVHIRYLRQKIDDPFAIKLIQTVRGKGYRLCAP